MLLLCACKQKLNRVPPLHTYFKAEKVQEKRMNEGEKSDDTFYQAEISVCVHLCTCLIIYKVHDDKYNKMNPRLYASVYHLGNRRKKWEK